MTRRYKDDESDFDANDLQAMRQVYGGLMREGASFDDLHDAFDPPAKHEDRFADQDYAVDLPVIL